MACLLNPRKTLQSKYVMVYIQIDSVQEPAVYHKSLKLMGNRFQLSAMGDDEEQANTYIEAGVEEIRRIEKLLTTYSEQSETAMINQYAGIKPVRVSEET